MKVNWMESLGFDLKWRVVAFIGGGGKTTAMEALADELTAVGKSVLMTTTTKIWYPENPCYEIVLRETIGVSQNFANELDKHCQKGLVVVSGEGVSEQGKIIGHSLDALDEIVLNSKFDVILVEADGSKGRSLKAHQADEPQIPHHTDFCYVVMGADIFGKPLNEEWVHRASLFTELTGLAVETTLTPEVIANFYRGSGGYLAKLPLGCPSAVVLTKVSSLPRYAQMLKLQAELPGCSICVAPVVGSKRDHQHEKQPVVRGILLAAGSASRFGSSKQLHKLFEKTFVEWVTGMLLATTLSEIVVVYKDQQVRQTLSSVFSKAVDEGRLMFAHNENAHEGQSTSVKVGMLAGGSHVAEDAIQGFMFFMSDQLFLDEETVQELLKAHQEGGITVPQVDGKLGSPVLFSAVFKRELASVTGDQGGREIIKKHPDQLIKVSVSSNALWDVDTQEALEDLIKMME